MAADETAPTQAGKPLSAEDLAEAQKGPAIYSNRVMVSVGPVVRITFVEQSEGKPYFRAAAALPHQTAIELANLLKRTLAEIEADLERFKVEEAAKAKDGIAKNG